MKIIPKLYICDLDLKKFYDMPIGEPFMIKNKCYSAVQREISSPCERVISAIPFRNVSFPLFLFPT